MERIHSRVVPGNEVPAQSSHLTPGLPFVACQPQAASRESVYLTDVIPWWTLKQ